MKDKVLIACILCLFFTRLQAQTGWTITGRVLEEISSEAMTDVNVLLYSTDSILINGVSTDDNGIFSLKTNYSGDYFISVTSVGYSQQRFDLSLNESNKNVIYPDILLQLSDTELSEVEVVARRRQMVYKLDKKVIEAAGYISASGGTAIDILEQTPSVRVDANGELTFRGSSGFKVYIDGKPTNVDGSAALEQIPAGQIENIEIISTPSAKNEADGIIGIINVNTKKQTTDGWSGMINAMGSTVKSRNIDFLTSYKNRKIRWQTSGEVSRKYIVSDFDQLKHIYVDDTLTTTRATGERKSFVDLYAIRSGLDLYKDKTEWSMALESRYRIRNRGGRLHYEDTYLSNITGAETNASYDGHDYVRLNDLTFRGDLGFNHRFSEDGHNLTGMFLAFYEHEAMEFFYTDLFDTNGNRAQGHRAWEYEYRFTAQGNLDYTLPFNNKTGKFDAGYYFFTYTEDGDYKADFYNPAQNIFERRNDLYNQYVFRRDIHALYSMLSNTHSGFSYQLGLRGEFIHRKLENSEAWARHIWNKFDLFPSLHLSYTFDKGSHLNLGYSRRITQPQLFYMEPYVVYVDYYTAQCGNPKIRPEYTNSIELTYNKTFGEHSAAATLFHRRRTDKIERVRVPYHTGITLDSIANVGDDYATGAEIVANLQALKWWNIDVNGSLFYYIIENEYKIDDEESLNWQFAFNNNFDIAKNTRMRLESYFVGPSVSTQGRVNDFFYFNFSIRQQLLGRRLSATLKVRDVLSTAKYVDSKNGMNLDSKTIIYPASPLITMSLSYAFNNFKSQKKEEKTVHDLFEGTNR
ncbi:MAG: TonB-dependent receptor family protein [Prevotellaceae bacterium]|jgi:outer membrane receptor protein involved in Fe transport|nr:TonB-dependent receptor family protein [Prevotellaceae bacterium]